MTLTFIYTFIYIIKHLLYKQKYMDTSQPPFYIYWNVLNYQILKEQHIWQSNFVLYFYKTQIVAYINLVPIGNCNTFEIQ